MKPTELMMKHRGKIASTLVILLLAGWMIWHHRADLSREALVAWGKELHPAWFIAAFCILPVLGFPLSILLLLAGVRFGLTGGMILATLGTFFHHFAAFYLAHGSFRDSVRRRLEKAGRRSHRSKRSTGSGSRPSSPRSTGHRMLPSSTCSL